MVKLGHRMMRALFTGVGVGMFGGFGIYLICEAINTLASAVVVNPIAFLLLILGGSIFTSLGIEWSNDIDEQKKQ